MERRRRSELQRVGLLLCAALAACGAAVQPRAQSQGEPLLPNERYHAVSPCEEHALAPGRVLLEVAIDEQGKPVDALVTPVGGTIRNALVDCVRTRLLAQKYRPRGKATTLSEVVDVRVGNFSTAGSPIPVPPSY